MRFREIITEAKNTIFADTTPFDQVSVTPLMKAAVDKILAPLGTEIYPIGSSANPKPGKESGDYDVQVDETDIAKQLARLWMIISRSRGLKLKRLASQYMYAYH